MGRPIILSNGRLMVGLDEHGLVHDLYYPFVGQENMTSSRQMHHKLGIWIDGDFSWLDDGTWKISLNYQQNALAGTVSYECPKRGVSIRTSDFVDSENDVFARRFYIKNTGSERKKMRFFMHQVFQISRSGRSDTAIYVPAKYPYVLSAHGNITFLAGLHNRAGGCFDQHAIGNYRIEGKAGTYIDAEDGELSGSNVEHGGVDSVIRASHDVDPGEEWNVDYWVSASANNYHEASKVHRLLGAGGLSHSEESTMRYWGEWLKKSESRLDGLDEKYKTAIKLSLMIIKAHEDEGGGVIASGDSSIYNYGRDYYNYVWPRDAALSLLPLVRLGYTDEAVSFLQFVSNVVNPKGYLHHKYQPDGSIGSTWHPLVQDGKRELNIQEDETAATVLLFCELEKTDVDQIVLDSIYARLIRPAGHFMAGFVDISTHLPHASYDLWEQIFQTSTYTACIVHNALVNAAVSAEKRGSEADQRHWLSTAKRLAENLPKLFSENDGYFAKGLRLNEGVEVLDTALDASTMAGLYLHSPLPTDDVQVKKTLGAVESLLKDTGPAGGVIRYQSDSYMLDKHKYTANPWNICSLWLARVYSRIGRKDEGWNIINGVMSHALQGGSLSEQIDPETGYSVGVAPLVWSHAELINAILDSR